MSSLKGRLFKKAWQELWLRFTVVFIIRFYVLHQICTFGGFIMLVIIYLVSERSVTKYNKLFEIKCNTKACTGQGGELPQTNSSQQFQNCPYKKIYSYLVE